MYVSADARALEWRLAIEFSGDPVGIDELEQGIDMHTANQKTFDLPSRLIAKIFLFRTIFRGTGYSFAMDPSFNHVSTDPDYWDEMNAKFYRKYAGLDKKHQEWCEEVWLTGKITVFTGRFWPIAPVLKWDRKTKSNVSTLPMPVLTNKPIQGTGNDVMAINRVALYNRMQRNKIPGDLVLTVHDSIVVDTPEPEEVTKLMYEVFDDLPKNVKKLFNYDMKTKIPCEVKIGMNLKEMREVPQ